MAIDSFPADTDKEISRVRIGDIEGGINQSIIAGGDVIIRQIYSRIDELDRETQLAERRLGEAIVHKIDSYTRLIQKRPDASRHNPYKALLDYKLEDTSYFYGRDHASQAMLALLRQSRLTILHAESGAGKSSLLQAGLAARLLVSGHLPIYVRAYNQPPAQAIKRAFLPDIERLPELKRLAQLSLTSFLAQVCQHLGESTLYLFLDQFEEFFVELPQEQQQNFAIELADCLNEPGLDVRWTLALRKDYFSDLHILRPYIPAPFENDYYLPAFSIEEAREVILKPAHMRQVESEDGLVNLILQDLSQDDNRLAPPQVQLVCYTLFEELSQAAGPRLITHELYQKERGRGGPGARGILSNHLTRVLERMKGKDRIIAHKILEALVTSQSRRVVKRKDALLDELKQVREGVDAKTIEAILAILVDNRLLRTDEDEQNRARYELAHDYLLTEIELDPATQARKAAQEMLTQEVAAWHIDKRLRIPADKLDIIEAQAPHLLLNEEATTLLQLSRDALAKTHKQVRRQQQVVRIGASLVIGLTVAAITLIVIALNANRAANRAATRRDAVETTVAQAEDRLAEIELLTQARSLNEQGLAIFEDEPLLGLRLAFEAWVLIPGGADNMRKLILPSIQEMSSHGRLLKLGDNIEKFIVSPDDTFVVLDRARKEGELWRIADNAHITTLPNEVNAVTYSPDTSYMVIDYGEVMRSQIHTLLPSELRRTADGSLILALKYKAHSVEFSSDPVASYVILGYNDPTLGDSRRDLRRTADGALIANVYGRVLFHAGAANFIVNGELRRFDNGALITQLPASAEYSPDSLSTYLVLTHSRYRQSDPPSRSRTPLTEAEREAFRFRNLHYSKDGSRVWLTGQAKSIMFSPDAAATYFVVTYEDEQLPAELRRSADNAVVAILDRDLESTSFSPDLTASYLVQFSAESTKMYRTVDGSMVISLTGEVLDVNFSPDSRASYFVVTYQDLDLPSHLYRTADGRLITILSGDSSRAIEFSPDSDASYVLLNYVEGWPELRRTVDGSVIITFTNFIINQAEFSPSGNYLLVVDTGYRRELYRVVDGAKMTFTYPLEGLIFSPNPNARFFIVKYDRFIGIPHELRDAQSGSFLTNLTGTVESVSFSPDADATYFIVKYSDGQSELWQAQGRQRRLARLGLGLDDYHFILDRDWLLVRYSDGRTYLLDLAWLKMLDSDPAQFLPEALMQLACQGPFATALFDEAKLSTYLDDSRACQAAGG